MRKLFSFLLIEISIIISLFLILLVGAYIIEYPSIMFEDFEDDFVQRTASCVNPDDACSANSPWGNFTNCDDNNGDYIFCTSDDGQEGDHTTYAIRMIDWGTFDSMKGLWYSFDPRGYDDVNVQGYISAASLDNVNEWCRIWARDSDSVATIYQCSNGEACEAGDSTPEPADYTFFNVNLSSLSGIDLTESQIHIHIGASQSGNQDFCFFDMINITGIIFDDPPNITSLDYPENNSYASSPISFNFTVIDDIGFSNCTLCGDFNGTWLANKTIYNTTIQNNTVNNISISLDEGTYSWNVRCFDNASTPQEDWFDSNYSVKIDSTVPFVTLNTPVNNYNTTSKNITFNFTAMDNIASTLNCSLYIDSVLNQTNSSVVNGSTNLFNVTNMSEGSHQWNITCLDGALNFNSSSRNLTIDLSVPAINVITLSPSSTDDIDPNVQINVTANLTDTVAIDTVIFQYRAYNESSWTNDTMDYNSTNIYLNASFTPTFNGTWQYRIWTNDSLANSGSSSIVNLSVQYDWSWTCSPSDFGAASAFVGTNASVGILTINNTGDYTLQFDLSSNWQTVGGIEKVYYNESEPFKLAAKGVKYFNVTALVSDNERSDDITITIDATNASASPDSLTTTATLIAYISGPFLYTKIDTYNSSIKQSETTELKAYVKNLGNETANNVTINWTLPSGWDTGDELNILINNVSVNKQVWSNITVEVTPSASAGIATVYINSSCAEGKNKSDSVSITVSCNNNDGVCGLGCTAATDTDCQVATTTISTVSAGGGGGLGAAELVEKLLTGEELINSSETFELVRGLSDIFPVSVKNIFEKTTLYNISIKIGGYLSQYMTFSPNMIDEIEFNEIKQFNVTIISPEYMERGTHELTIIITGKLIGLGVKKDLTEARTVTLVIHTVSEEEASRIIELAMADIKTMTDAGFPTTKISKLLEDAKKALDYHEYDNVNDLAEKIRTIKETAFKANDLIQEVKSKMKRYVALSGAFTGSVRGFTETEEVLNLAIAAFEREDFDTALQRAEDAQLTLALERGEFNLLFFLADYWWAIVVSVVLLSVTGVFGYQRYVTATITQKIRNLEKEEETIRKLMEETQEKHFKEKTIGAATFRKTMDQHKKRLSKVRQLETKLRHKRLRLLKPEKLIKDLEEERKDLINLLKNLQSDYFVERKVSKAEYDEHQKVYNERLAEIEDEHLTLETKLSKKVG